jgi:hypothetical protein
VVVRRRSRHVRCRHRPISPVLAKEAERVVLDYTADLYLWRSGLIGTDLSRQCPIPGIVVPRIRKRGAVDMETAAASRSTWRRNFGVPIFDSVSFLIRLFGRRRTDPDQNVNWHLLSRRRGQCGDHHVGLPFWKKLPVDTVVKCPK